MIKTTEHKHIDDTDWDALVRDTYGKPYTFQEQNDCRDRGSFYLTIPSVDTGEELMHEDIPEEVNGEKMGVKFSTWLSRDPEQPIAGQKYDWERLLFWDRNFYPDVYTLANDLHKKGLIEAGDYVIDIDW